MNQEEQHVDTRDKHAQRGANEGQVETPAVSRSQSAVSGDELSVAGAPDAADPLDPSFLSYNPTAAKAQFGHYSRRHTKKEDSRHRDPRREPLTQAQCRAATVSSDSNEPNERQTSPSLDPTSVEPVAEQSSLARVEAKVKPQSVAAPTSVPVLFVADDPDEPMKQRIVDAIARRAPSRLEAVLRTLSDASQWDSTTLSAYLAAVRDVLGGIDGRPELTDAEVEDNAAAMRAMRPRLAAPSLSSLPPQEHLLNSQCSINGDDDITTSTKSAGGPGPQKARKPRRDSSRVLDGRLEAPEHPATFFVEYPNPDSAFADYPIAAEEFVLRSPPSSSAGALHVDPRSHQNALPRGSYSERAQDNAMPVRLPEHISMRSTHTAATGERASRQGFHRPSHRGQLRPGEKRRQPVSSAAQHVVTTPPSTADTSRDFLEPFPHQRRVGGPDVITHLHDQSDCGDPQVSQLARTVGVRGATTALQELSWTDDSTVNAAAAGLERQAAAELEFVQQQDAALRYAAPELAATVDAGLVASQRTATSYRSDTDPGDMLRQRAPRSFGLEPGAIDHLGAAIPDDFGRIGTVSLAQPRRIGNDGAGALRAMLLQRALPEDRRRTFV